MSALSYGELANRIVRRTRTYAALNAVVGIALVPLTLAIYGIVWWAIAGSVVLLALALVAARQWQRLRPDGPIALALAHPTRLDRVCGWPVDVPRPLAIQVFVGDDECKLKIDRASIAMFVQALRREAPTLRIDVPATLLELP